MREATLVVSQIYARQTYVHQIYAHQTCVHHTCVHHTYARQIYARQLDYSTVAWQPVDHQFAVWKIVRQLHKDWAASGSDNYLPGRELYCCQVSYF